MVTNTIKQLVAGEVDSVDHSAGRDCKILDFNARRGTVGKLLAEDGFSQVYAQEGSEHRKSALLKKGYYKDVEAYIVGKLALPHKLRRSFDVVTCSGGLGTNLLPARCFEDMLAALKPRGYVIFTLSQKHLCQ